MVDEEARRIAQHVVPIAAVADVALIVLGGGIGANGDLLLAPIRALLAERCPYPPRVEVSSLGDAAVLTGALAIGLRAALDNVFVNRIKDGPPILMEAGGIEPPTQPCKGRVFPLAPRPRGPCSLGGGSITSTRARAATGSRCRTRR